MTPEQAAAALDNKGKPRKRWENAPADLRVRKVAMAKAQSDALQALARLHADEYRVIYETAVQRRFAEAKVTEQ